MQTLRDFLYVWEILGARGVINDSTDQVYPDCKLYRILALVCLLQRLLLGSDGATYESKGACEKVSHS